MQRLRVERDVLASYSNIISLRQLNMNREVKNNFFIDFLLIIFGLNWNHKVATLVMVVEKCNYSFYTAVNEETELPITASMLKFLNKF